MELNGQVALVTGGAQGIGFAYVQQLLQNQVKVCICDISESVGKESEKILQEKYGKENVIFKKCDVTDSEQLEGCFRYTKEYFGKLDIVINNAGIANEDEDNWEKMIDLNFKAVVDGTTLGFKYMSKQFGGNGGTILNTSSYIALFPYHTIVPGLLYASIKKAVFYYTTTLGMKNAYTITGVRTLTICPGLTDTPLLEKFTDKGCPHFLDNTMPTLKDLVRVWPEKKLDPEYVGKAMIHMLKNGESGSAWAAQSAMENPVKVKFTLTGVDESIITEPLKNIWILQ